MTEMNEKMALWRKAKEIVADALELAPAQRDALLAQRCGDDQALLREVQSLLTHARDDTSIIDTSAKLVSETLATESAAAGAWIGQTLGAWRLEREIGHGGMGIVYLAQRADGAYRQSAAVKLLRGSASDARSVARMRRERQTLAQLEHPNIARLLDGGSAADGTPYLVMEYVEGQAIDQYCQQHDLAPAAIIALMVSVCGAVQSAHQRLVIHRDLKPTNVLVTQAGVPKLLDFGVARLLEPQDGGDIELTHGALLFTPRYASPEQVRGLPVSVATDVYGLGLLLYELLAGESPYERLSSKSTNAAMGVAAAMQAVMSDALRKPSQVARLHRPANAELLRGDLDTILLKACARDANERYPTVAALSADLTRYVQNRPITARSPTWVYVAGKFARRHALGVGLAGLAVAAVMAGFTGTVLQKNRAEAEHVKAEARYQQVRDLASRMVTDYNEAIAKLPGGTELRRRMTGDAIRYLDELAREVPEDPSLALQMAQAYRTLGGAGYSETAANLGQGKLSDESLRKSAALLAGVAAQQEGKAVNRELELEWGETHRAMARRHRAQGDYDKAQQFWEEVVARFEALSKAAPREPQYRFQTLDSYFSLAALAIAYQRRSGQDYIASARQQMAGWLALSPPAQDRDYMAIRALRTDYQQAQFERNAPAALAFIGQEVVLQQQRVRGAPDNVEWVRELASALKTQGGIQMVAGKFADALGAQEQALALMLPLMEADAADMLARTEVLWLNRDRAISLANLERKAEALAGFEKAFALCAPMTDTDKTTLLVVRLCVNAAWWTTRSRLRFDRHEEAKESAQRILLIRDKFPHLFESKLERLWLKNAEEAIAGLPLTPPNTEAPISRPVGPAALPASAAAR